MKKIFFVFVLSLLAMPFISSASGFSGNPSYTLGRDAVADKNLYVAGNSISILGIAREDVIAVGGNIIVLGDVRKDLNAAGGTLAIDGIIGDDARLAGGTLAISGKISGELLAAGGQINLNPDLEISGEARLAGGNILVDGTIDNKLFVYGETIRIDGKVDGDVVAKAGKNLVIGSKAEISGKLDYSAPQKLIIEDGAKIVGEVNFTEITPVDGIRTSRGFWGFIGVAWLMSLLMALAAALAVYFLLGKKLEGIINDTLDNFGKETLRGFIILVALPIAAIIAFITVIGIMLGIAGLLLYVVMAIFASIFAPIVLGSIIFRKLLKKPEFAVDWKSILTGVIVIKIAGLIPFIGWIISLVFFLAAFGVLFNYLYRHFRKA